MEKTAFITGVTGQDGTYLTKLLLQKGYSVHGLVRRSSQKNTYRLDEMCLTLKKEMRQRLILHYGDITDAINIYNLIESIQPNEIYNLAAQSHVHISFDTPIFTSDVNALGALRILEAVKNANLIDKTRIYQASTSELFGQVSEIPQCESTPFHPRSPYAVAKLYAHWIMKNYREAYHLFASTGILFNHESPLRTENFVTRKITLSVAKILSGCQKNLCLGNLNAKRDWGHAWDYVNAMWKILNHHQPDDFVIATGQQHSVREFVSKSFACLGYDIRWEGTGLHEIGISKVPVFREEHLLFNDSSALTDLPHEERPVVLVDPAFFRPAEVNTLQGDYSKAKNLLGWHPTISFDDLVHEMTLHDYQALTQNSKKF
ncbi:MAG: GDP-mannose 4,6-dehydratase [Planctomycetia bacterium]|nr:GDP-mannose 4,6-dehydratase [Planctomycetia bacterium]